MVELRWRSIRVFVKSGGILGHGAEQKCTTGALVSSINVTLLRVSSGALSGSEVGGVYASVESPAERVVAACRLVALPIHLKDVNAVSETVQECAGQPLGAEDLGPLVEGRQFVQVQADLSCPCEDSLHQPPLLARNPANCFPARLLGAVGLEWSFVPGQNRVFRRSVFVGAQALHPALQ